MKLTALPYESWKGKKVVIHKRPEPTPDWAGWGVSMDGAIGAPCVVTGAAPQQHRVYVKFDKHPELVGWSWMPDWFDVVTDNLGRVVRFKGEDSSSNPVWRSLAGSIGIIIDEDPTAPSLRYKLHVPWYHEPVWVSEKVIDFLIPAEAKARIEGSLLVIHQRIKDGTEAINQLPMLLTTYTALMTSSDQQT